METEIAEVRPKPLARPAIRAAYDAPQRRSAAPVPPFEAFADVVRRELLPLL